MRQTLFLLAALAWGTAATAAAQDTIMNREIHVGNSVLQKTVTESREGSSVHTRKTWNIGLLGISVTRDKYSDGDSASISDSYGTDRLAHCFEGHFMNLYFAFTGMSTGGFDVKGGNSWEWGAYLLQESRSLSASQHFGVTLALGFSRSYYRLKGDGVLQADAAGQTVVMPIDPTVLEYTKPGINYWSWRLPVMLEWQRHTNNNPYVSFGVEAELRHHVRSRVHKGHDRKYVIAGNSLDVQPWACNLMVQGGWDGFSVFARIGLTDFFGDKAAFGATPFAIGIGF